MTNDVSVHLDSGQENIKVVWQKRDQARSGKLACLVAVPVWGIAGPVRIIAERLWFREWLGVYRDRRGRMSSDGVPEKDGTSPDVRARFGCWMATTAITAAIESALVGRVVSPKKGGARLHGMKGMSRETTK